MKEQYQLFCGKYVFKEGVRPSKSECELLDKLNCMVAVFNFTKVKEKKTEVGYKICDVLMTSSISSKVVGVYMFKYVDGDEK